MFLISGQSYRRLIRLRYTEIIEKIRWRLSRKLKVLLFQLSTTKGVRIADIRVGKRISFVNDDFLESVEYCYSERLFKEADDICDGYFLIHDSGRIQWKLDTTPWREWKSDEVRSFHRHDFLITLLRVSRCSRTNKYSTMIELLIGNLFMSYPIDMIIKYDKPIDIAIRFLNWSAVYSLLKKYSLTKKELVHWYKQIEWMRANMSPGGNHRVLESLCLFAAGIFFCEIVQSKKWMYEGKKILLKEMEKQVWDDGVHAEQSMYYQQIVTTHFLKFVLLCKKKGHKLPKSFMEQFLRMLEYVWLVEKPDGVHPMIGDGDELTSEEREHWEARALIPFYLKMQKVSNCGNESLEWFCHTVPDDLVMLDDWKKKNKTNPCQIKKRKSHLFERGGHAILRDNEGNYLFFNCGHFGYRPYPHHGHADALSAEICMNGETVVMDTGGYAYRNDIYRYFARSTAAHNTIELDRSDQSEIYGVFGVGKMADVYVEKFCFTHNADEVEGYHNGYSPAIHRRRVIFIKHPIKVFLIYDKITGEGVHDCRLFFHIAPEVKVTKVGQDRLKIYGKLKPVGSAFFLGDSKLFVEVYKGDGVNDVQGMISKRTKEVTFNEVVRIGRKDKLPVEFISIFTPENDIGIDVQNSNEASIVLRAREKEHIIDLLEVKGLKNKL